MKNTGQILFILIMLISCFSVPLPAETTAAPVAAEPENLFDMSLTELMQVDISLASKKEEKLMGVPTAAYVITAEDIRRSGATNIPDLLRMVPGMHVYSASAGVWSVSARGYSNVYANKMLVMIDNRSLYCPLYGGTFWDMSAPMLEDIERIEVIRGPGGTLWGANAVNGVINIITKKASDTQGGLVSGGAGTEDLGFGAIRYGGKLSDKTFYRAYLRYFNVDDRPAPDGSDGSDEWYMTQGGFRTDTQISEKDLLTFQGDAYSGMTDYQNILTYPGPPFMQIVEDQGPLRGGNLLGRWTTTLPDDSEMTFQIYYDRAERHQKNCSYSWNTLDMDMQHRFDWTDGQEITWGLNYRWIRDDVKGSYAFYADPQSRTMQTYSGFVQDKITLAEDKLYLTLGSKFERNAYTDFEYQPSARIAWTPDENQTVWAAVSRAVHTPTRYERDSGNYMMTFPFTWQNVKNPDFGSEELIAYEIGYRVKPTDRLSIDTALFLNDYQNMRTWEYQAVGMNRIYSNFNNMTGETYGGELAAAYEMTDNWKLSAGYSYLQMQMHASKSSNYDSGAERIEGESAHNLFNIRSYMNIAKDLEFDTMLYYVDNLPGQDLENYIRLDIRLGWHISPNTELSLVGQNLLDNRHQEFTRADFQEYTESQRAFYAKLTHRF